MKTPLLYGSLSALVGALMQFGLHFAGFYDSAEKLSKVTTLQNIIGTVTLIVCMVLAVRARRAEFPANREWGYGSALGTAFMTGLFSTLIGVALWYIYVTVINPSSIDVMIGVEVAKMEASGKTDAQIEQARNFMGPGIMTAFALVGLTFASFIFALIVAIFFRKKPAPALSEFAPPPVV